MTPDDTATIASKEELAAFLDQMLADHQSNGAQWENQDIPSFLDAFQSWLRASDNFYRNMRIDKNTVNPWREVADAFAAARIYE